MHSDLSARRLVVAKIRTENGWVRAVMETNPEWYQELCAGYMNRSKRFPKFRTIIKRQHVLRTLMAIGEGHDISTVYAERLRPFIQSEIARHSEG